MPAPKQVDEKYSDKEAQERFEAALRAGLKTPHKPLKDTSKVKKMKEPRKTRGASKEV